MRGTKARKYMDVVCGSVNSLRISSHATDCPTNILMQFFSPIIRNNRFTVFCSEYDMVVQA